MSFYKEISPIFEYLHQVRKLENYIVFDVLFSKTWKIPKKYIVEDKFLNKGTLEDKLYLSFVSDFDENNLNLIQNNILGIVRYNLEREAKEKLFEDRVSELKNIFDKENLENLKKLKFELTQNVLVDNGQRQGNTETTGISQLIEE
jgi:hypothetical protein